MSFKLRKPPHKVSPNVYFLVGSEAPVTWHLLRDLRASPFVVPGTKLPALCFSEKKTRFVHGGRKNSGAAKGGSPLGDLYGDDVDMKNEEDDVGKTWAGCRVCSGYIRVPIRNSMIPVNI